MGGKSSTAKLMSSVTPSSSTDLHRMRQLEPQLAPSHPLNPNSQYSHLAKLLDGQFAGEGIARTPAYQCLVSPEELSRQRALFWETRVEGSAMAWRTLRYAIEDANFKMVLKLLKLQRLKLVKSSLQLSFNAKGEVFALPVWVINDPAFYSEQARAPAVPARPVTLTLHYNSKPYKVDCNLRDSLKDLDATLSKVFSTESDFDPEKEALKLAKRGKVFGGESLVSDFADDEGVIQVFRVQRQAEVPLVF